MQSHSVLVWCGQGIYTPKPEGLHLVSRCLSQRVAGCFSFWSVKMNDRELLESAAKAAGYKLERFISALYPYATIYTVNDKQWDPLTDDGDALRLSVKLRIWVEYYGCGSSVPAYVSANYHLSIYRGTRKYVNVYYVPDEMFTSDRQDERSHALYQMEEEGHPRGIEVATRRAIVRAAAEIGRQMQEGGAA